ncbi:MAG: hypothetical protein IT167_01985 [Bryobacterales bacterium]|nr:hypothetical protein [Bryobacterales bacterium]
MKLFWIGLLAAGLSNAQPARDLVERGMDRFVRGEIAASVKDFDEAARLEPAAAPQLWQRGIALYYLGRFEEGRRQFESHRAVNPNDVENAAWWYLCMARLGKREEARGKLLPVGPDDRVPMMELYALYSGHGSEKDVLQAMNAGTPSFQDKRFRAFYGYFYLGLYWETEGNAAKARGQIRKAVQTNIGGYMWEVARIHLEQMLKRR